MKNKILILLLSVLSVSCISDYNPTLPDKEKDILVVEGTIVGNSTCTFYLGKNLSLNAVAHYEDYTVDGVITLIDDKGMESAPAERMSKGEYRLPVGALDANTKYGVRVVYNNDVYESDLSYPLSTPPIDDVAFSQPESYGSVELNVSTHDTATEIGYYRWFYEEDWEETAPLFSLFTYDIAEEDYIPLDPNTYYCWHKTRTNKQTVASTSKLRENRIINQPFLVLDEPGFRFNTLYCVTVIQQVLSRRGFEYYQSKQNLNDDMGGIFAPVPSMVEGNISCISDPDKRTIGYIEVNKNQETMKLFIYPGQISSSKDRNCEVIPQDSVAKYLAENRMTLSGYYLNGYRPVVVDPNGPFDWGEGRCVDCQKNGGTKIRPDWWPDNGHH